VNIVKNTAVALLLAFSTNIFAQEDAEIPAESDQPAAPAEQPKNEKKSPIAVGAQEERPLGVRAGIHISTVGSYGGGTFSWQLGALYDVMRILDVDFGDAFQLRMLFEPGAFITPRNSAIDGKSQYWIEVPVTAAFTLSVFGSMRVKYALGPYVAFGTIGKFSDKIETVIPFLGTYTTEWTQSRFDVGHWHTFGFEQDHFKNWWFDITFAFGLMDAVEIKTGGTKTTPESAPFDMKFTIGYNF